MTQKELLVAMENDEQFMASKPLSANNTEGSGIAPKGKKKKAEKKPAATAAATAAVGTNDTAKAAKPDATSEFKADSEGQPASLLRILVATTWTVG